MQRRGITLIEAVVIVAIACIMVVVLIPPGLPLSHGSRLNARRSSCQSNLKQIALVFKQYSQDADEHFPTVAFSPPNYGWADALQPYLKSVQIYQCPSEPNAGQNDPTQRNYTDYWYNHNLSCVEEASIKSVALTILAGDGNDGHDLTNARYSLSQIPPPWLKDRASPAYRHVEGMNFAFADGHVKWYRADKLSPRGIPALGAGLTPR